MIKLIKRGDQNQTTAMKTLLALLRLYLFWSLEESLCVADRKVFKLWRLSEVR